MKVIDMHIHSHTGTPCPEELLKKMEAGGVWGGCVFSNQPLEAEEPGGSDFETRLNNTLAWCRGYEDRLFPVLWVHPNEENIIEKINVAVKAGIVAFKMICDNYYVYEERSMAVIREIARLGKPIMFHTGILWDGAVSSDYNRPIYWEHLLNVEGLKFSLAHCAWPWNDEVIAMYGKFLHAQRCGKHVEMFFDTTPGTPEVYRKEHYTRLFYVGYETGDNVMFGTDADAETYSKDWASGWLKIEEKILDELGVDLKTRQKMYHDNILRFLGKSDAVSIKEAPKPDSVMLWSPENPEVKALAKKWYEKLEFPKEFDKEFYRALESIKLTDAMTPERYDLDCEDGKKNLLYYLYFCEAVSKKFEERGIPESIMMDTLKDIVVWAKNWYCVKGTLHLSQLDWLSYHVTFRIFRLGRLQFCLHNAKEDIPQFDIKKGDRVIEIHIPQGDKLDNEECKKSIEMAKEFFKKYFPEFDYKAFVCDSWLLDNDLKEYLSLDSNIIKFGDMFTRIRNHDDNALLRYLFRWDTNEINLRYAHPTSAFAERIRTAVLGGKTFHETLGVIKA